MSTGLPCPRLLVALALGAALASCSSKEPEPLYKADEPGHILKVKVFDAWRTAGQLKGTVLCVFTLPEEGRFVGKPEARILGQAPERIILSPREASVYYYPVSQEGRLETRPVEIVFAWHGADKDKVEKKGEASLVVRYTPDLSFAIQDCQVTEEEANPKPPAPAAAPVPEMQLHPQPAEPVPATPQPDRRGERGR